MPEAHVRLKLQWCMSHHNEILEQIRNLHGIPFGELDELALQVQKSLAEGVAEEEIRIQDDLPEV